MDNGFERVLGTPELAARLRIPLYWAGYDMSVCRFDRRMIPESVERAQADVVIVDALMAGLDAADLAEKIAARPMRVMPALIALFPPGSSEAMEAAARRGVVCLEGFWAREENILREMRALSLENRLSPLWASLERAEDRLRRLSVAEGTAGSRYLVRAVTLCARDYRCFGRLSAWVYPIIARENGTTAAAVERLMRHAIEAAWLRGDIDAQYAFFGNTVDASKGKPTNSEFIARITEALRLEANT